MFTEIPTDIYKTSPTPTHELKLGDLFTCSNVKVAGYYKRLGWEKETKEGPEGRKGLESHHFATTNEKTNVNEATSESETH